MRTACLSCAPSLQRRNRGEKSSCIKQLNGGNYPPFLTCCQLFSENLPARFEFGKKSYPMTNREQISPKTYQSVYFKKIIRTSLK